MNLKEMHDVRDLLNAKILLEMMIDILPGDEEKDNQELDQPKTPSVRHGDSRPGRVA